MEQRRRLGFPVIGLGGAAACAVNDKNDTVSGHPPATVDNLLHNGGKIGRLVFGIERIPGRYIVPGDIGCCPGAARQIAHGGCKGWGIVTIVGIQGYRGRCLTDLIRFKLKISVVDRSALWDQNISKAYAYRLLPSGVGIVTDYQIGAICIHSAVSEPLFDIVNGVGDTDIQANCALLYLGGCTERTEAIQQSPCANE